MNAWKRLCLPAALLVAVVASPLGADTYWEVWRNTTNNLSSADVVLEWFQGTNWTDGSAAPGVPYYYWVRSINAGTVTAETPFGLGNASLTVTYPFTAPGANVDPRLGSPIRYQLTIPALGGSADPGLAYTITNGLYEQEIGYRNAMNGTPWVTTWYPWNESNNAVAYGPPAYPSTVTKRYNLWAEEGTLDINNAADIVGEASWQNDLAFPLNPVTRLTTAEVNSVFVSQLSAAPIVTSARNASGIKLSWTGNGLTSSFGAAHRTIGLWLFDEKTSGTANGATGGVVDSSGNGHHGTAFGAPTYIPGSPDAGGTSALRFTPQTYQGVAVADDDAFDFDRNESFTIEGMIRVFPAADGPSLTIAHKGGLGGQQWFLRVNESAPSIGQIQFNADSGVGLLSHTTTICDGNWHHIAGVYDGQSGEMGIYIDGALDNSTVVSTSGSCASEDPVLIGSFTTYRELDQGRGDIDFVRISSGALSPSEFLTPEPLSASLLGIGGFFLLRRRMRCAAQQG